MAVKAGRRASGGNTQPHPAPPVPTLAQAIEQFRRSDLTDNAQAVLKRLLSDPRAGEAFSAIARNERDLTRLLQACVEADTLARTFAKSVEHCSAMPQRLATLRTALADIRVLLTETADPDNPLAAAVRLLPPDDTTVKYALTRLERHFDATERVAAETFPRLGATRKTSIARAGETAAIGWLADAVRRIGGRPHTINAAAIAEIALGSGCVSEDRIREALRTRKQRDWREAPSQKKLVRSNQK